MRQQVVQAEILKHGKPYVVTTSASNKSETISWEPTEQGGVLFVECSRDSQIVAIDLASTDILSEDGAELIVIFKQTSGVLGGTIEWGSHFKFRDETKKFPEYSALAYTTFRFVVRGGAVIIASVEAGWTGSSHDLGIDWLVAAYPEGRSFANYTSLGNPAFIKGTGEYYEDLVIIERKKGSNSDCRTFPGAVKLTADVNSVGVDVWYVDANNDAIVAAGTATAATRVSTDSGGTWGAGGSIGSGHIKAIKALSGDNWLASGNDSKIWRSTNNGTSWTQVATLTFVPAGFAYDACSGYVLAWDVAVSTKTAISDDDGATWTEYSTGAPTNVVNVVYHRATGHWVFIDTSAQVHYSASVTGGAPTSGTTLSGTPGSMLSTGSVVVIPTTNYVYVAADPTGGFDRFAVDKSDGTSFSWYAAGIWRGGVAYTYGGTTSSTHYAALGGNSRAWRSGLGFWDTGTWL